MSPTGWRVRRLLSAPHRLGFAAGAALMSLLALWWLTALALPLPWAVPPALAHGLLFTLGFMPAFMAGFLFTAGPRWLGVAGVDARALLMPLLQFGAGQVLLLAGVHTAGWLAACGQAMAAVGWLRLTLRFAALLRASRAEDRLHPRWLAAAGGVGVMAQLLACHALLVGDAAQLRAAVQLGLWGFVAPVFMVASHRMLPLLAAAKLPWLDALGPRTQLGFLLGCLGLGGVAQAHWLPPVLLAPPLALAAVALGGLAWRWRHPRGAAGRLVAMLRTGLAWLGVALGLQALSCGLLAAGREGLGAAPLHALTLGWLGCTLMAMATRVIAGHSGRPLAVDRTAWRLHLLLQLAVLLRLAATLGWGGAALLLLAAAAWAGVAAGWSWRSIGWLGRPRQSLDEGP